MAQKYRRNVDDPVMSDLTILVSVEDLINIAMGPTEANTVNYKMIQTVLHILARQMRLLETKVDIKIADVVDTRKKKKKDHSHTSEETPSSEASPNQDNMAEIEEEKKRRDKKDKSSKDKDKSPRDTKDKSSKDVKDKEKTQTKYSSDNDTDGKEEKAKSKEREKMDKMSPKEREKQMNEQDKQKKRKELISDDENEAKESAAKISKSVKEKMQKVLEKMTPQEKEAYKKQNEKEEEIMKNMSPKEKEKYLKKKEKELDELQQMNPKEKEKYFKEKEKFLQSKQQKSPADKEKQSKEKEEQKSAKEKDAGNVKQSKEKEEQKSAKEKDAGNVKQSKEKEEQKSAKEKDAGNVKQSKEKEDQKSTKEKDAGNVKQSKEKEELKSTKEDTEKEKAGKIKERKERERKILEKMSPKEKEIFIKQKEREEKVLEKMTPKEKELFLKQKDREEKALEKMTPVEKAKYFEEKEKEQRTLEKISPKEREKYLQEKEEEAIALDKMTPNERDKYLKEKKRQATAKSTSSGTSIAISEVQRQHEKVLIVEKGPTTRAASKTRVGSIEVVTISQFNVLRAEVERLKQTAAPLPMPALPDNKKLKADLVKGSASLTDTMQAMQVSARVQAAETGLARMAGLLTQLAASGALPESFAGQLEDAKADMEVLKSDLQGGSPSTSKWPAPSQTVQARKSVAIDPQTTKQLRDLETGTGQGTGTSRVASRASSVGTDKRVSVAGVSLASRHSRASGGRLIPVSRSEMDDAIQSMRDDMTKTMQMMTYRAASSAETAAGTAKGISDKMDIAMKLDARISELYALTLDYAEQLSGFDAGLSTQMQSFQEQMAQMRADLKTGLVQLETANNNAETAALLELTERYTGLQSELEGSLVEHHRLAAFQKQLGEELRGLVEAVETLKEQKADRDEVWDGLRDKADLSRLSGLLTEEEFSRARAELDEKLDVCYNKFNRQEAVWIEALKDLTLVTEDKAELLQLMSLKDECQEQLRSLQEQLRLLTLQLGEPKAAILTRLLSKDGKCAACMVPALMEATDPIAGKPYPLPALRPPPDGEPCEPDFTPIITEDEDAKTHICNRWVGGSHTLLSRASPREAAPAQLAPARPVKKYTGYGADGKLYKMEVDLEPCIECNKLTSDEVKDEAGAGDTAPKVCECWPGVEFIKELEQHDHDHDHDFGDLPRHSF